MKELRSMQWLRLSKCCIAVILGKYLSSVGIGPEQ
jgi:hypothetical protein